MAENKPETVVVSKKLENTSIAMDTYVTIRKPGKFKCFEKLVLRWWQCIGEYAKLDLYSNGLDDLTNAVYHFVQVTYITMAIIWVLFVAVMMMEHNLSLLCVFYGPQPEKISDLEAVMAHLIITWKLWAPLSLIFLNSVRKKNSCLIFLYFLVAIYTCILLAISVLLHIFKELWVPCFITCVLTFLYYKHLLAVYMAYKRTKIEDEN